MPACTQTVKKVEWDCGKTANVDEHVHFAQQQRWVAYWAHLTKTAAPTGCFLGLQGIHIIRRNKEGLSRPVLGPTPSARFWMPGAEDT